MVIVLPSAADFWHLGCKLWDQFIRLCAVLVVEQGLEDVPDHAGAFGVINLRWVKRLKVGQREIVKRIRIARRGLNKRNGQPRRSAARPGRGSRRKSISPSACAIQIFAASRLGSNTSRKPSPTKFRLKSVTTRSRHGKTSIHQYIFTGLNDRNAIAGQRPPRRQRRIHADTQEAQERFLQNRRRNGQRRINRDRPDRFGRICRKKMRHCGSPIARHASMYGCDRIDRTCPRTTRAMVSQLTNPIARNMHDHVRRWRRTEPIAKGLEQSGQRPFKGDLEEHHQQDIRQTIQHIDRAHEGCVNPSTPISRKQTNRNTQRPPRSPLPRCRRSSEIVPPSRDRAKIDRPSMSYPAHEAGRQSRWVWVDPIGAFGTAPVSGGRRTTSLFCLS